MTTNLTLDGSVAGNPQAEKELAKLRRRVKTLEGEHTVSYMLGSSAANDRVRELETEVARLTQWVHELQSGMYINCVYCGHRYGPADQVPATMQQALYAHIAECPKHPLSKALRENNELLEVLEDLVDHQNGCPLPSYEEGWTAAMEKAEKLLEKRRTH